MIEKEEAWKRQFSNLQICEGEEGRMERSVKGWKAKEKSREQNFEIRQHSDKSEDKAEFFKTRKYGRRYDNFDMPYAHQEDDKSEKLWSRIDGKCNAFSDFELLIF